MLVLRRRENRSTRRKNSRSRVENQQQTQPTYDTGSENQTRDTLVGGERSHHCAKPAPYSTCKQEVAASTTNWRGCEIILKSRLFEMPFFYFSGIITCSFSYLVIKIPDKEVSVWPCCPSCTLFIPLLERRKYQSYRWCNLKHTVESIIQTASSSEEFVLFMGKPMCSQFNICCLITFL